MKSITKRAMEDNRQGGHAKSPTKIPKRGWLVITRRIIARNQSENLSIVAAGIGFFGLLAIFPLIIATVSIYGLLADPTTVEQHFDFIVTLIPEDAASVFRDELQEIVRASPTALGWGVAISILVAIAASLKGVKALMSGMNIVYREDEKRGFFKLNATALAFSLGAICFIILALGLIAIVPAVLNIMGLGELGVLIANLIRWPSLAIGILVSLELLRRYGPSRSKPKWRWVTLGTIFSMVIWLLASFFFSYYVNNFGDFNTTYGSLAGVIVLLMWFYITSYVILIGATFNAESEHQTEHDTTTGKPRAAA